MAPVFLTNPVNHKIRYPEKRVLVLNCKLFIVKFNFALDKYK